MTLQRIVEIDEFLQKYGKRIFDLCLTVPAFVVLSPVMLVTAGLVAVKLGRPVLFTSGTSRL